MNALVTNAERLITLSVIRSLGGNGVDVTGASDDLKASPLRSKYCSKRIQCPSPSNENDFILFMEKILRKGDYDVLFPVWMDALLAVSHHRDRFIKYTKIPLPEHEKLERAYDKAETLKTAIHNNIPCPKTYFVRDMGDVKNLMGELDYPVVIKPRKSFGAKGVSYVSTPDELIQGYKQTASNHKNPLIQECIPLDGEIYGLEALFNKDSTPRAVFVHKRIRQYPITGGQSTLRESVVNPEVEKLGIKLLKSLDWYGVAMVEFKIDPRDKKPKLMEINPRFWGSLPLAIASGVDFPYLLYRMAMDGDIKPVHKYKVGVKCRSLLPGDIRYLRSAMRDDFSHLGFKKPDRLRILLDFLKFYEKDLHYDIISLDDWKPALIEITNILLRKFGRLQGVDSE